ncbi:saccharopine dehydrogenase family protein [Nocardioides sp. MAHUQ-72]|uniref:saccharopine dehydrogenase family protein n=1 Tax=unclassified Nocardioides TaxID=2615069 RepID=UPI00360C2B17
MSKDVLVYGAYGHTGRFVVGELLRQGLRPVLSGRDRGRLEDLGARLPGLEVRPAAVHDGEALAHAVRGAAVVVNCAGPFLDTALPVAAAAVGAGAHYLDVSAEQPAVQAVYDAHDARSRPLDVAVVPAMAFYGGLADLLATSVTGAWDRVDAITVAVGLDRWWPTEGTRTTGHRNTATRLVVRDGRLVPVADPARVREWGFPDPLGRQAVVDLPFSEIVVMSRHLPVSEVDTCLSTVALQDVRDPATPAPEAVDETGSSAQRFVVEVVARRGEEERRVSASGRDIYAVTAPLVVEAARRLVEGRAKVLGAAAPGEVFDAADFLDALGPQRLLVRHG